MQSKEELEKWHLIKDPWGYENNPDDAYRKEVILSILQYNRPFYTKYQTALDIGAGEGWITKDIPAIEIDAIEISDNAAARFPVNVSRVTEPKGHYDLVITTGTLYKQYDNKQILQWIKESKPKTLLIAGIEDWLVDLPFGEPIKEIKFPYREYIQVIKLYAFTAQYWDNTAL